MQHVLQVVKECGDRGGVAAQLKVLLAVQVPWGLQVRVEPLTVPMNQWYSGVPPQVTVAVRATTWLLVTPGPGGFEFKVALLQGELVVTVYMSTADVSNEPLAGVVPSVLAQ